MNAPYYDPDEQVTVIEVPLDDPTFAWVIELAELCHADVRLVIASILRDIRADDEAAHFEGLVDFYNARPSRSSNRLN